MIETDSPPPMTPPDCDLRGYDFMPFRGTHFFGSKFYSLARRNPRAGLAGVKLWWESWLQCPAASLPADDFDLCDMAGFGEDMPAWRAAKDTALHGFILCSDGRLYHPFLAVEAVKAFELRLRSDAKRSTDRDRLRAWREGRMSTRTAALTDTPSETPGETRFETSNEMGVEIPVVAGDKTMTRQSKKYSSSPKKSWASATSEPLAELAGFDLFWGAYPKKVGKDAARKAFVKAMGRATLGDIMAGLARFKWSTDPQFWPHAASWLNGGRWQDEADQPTPIAGSANARAGGQFSESAGRVLTEAELFEVCT